MNPRNLTIKGFSTAFANREETFQFEKYPEGLVAIVGQMGRGKSHVLEASGPAALYLNWPSYGDSLITHVPDGVRDAAIVLDFDAAGKKYRAKVVCDPEFSGGKGRTQAYLFELDGDDVTPIAGPNQREYLAAVQRILPPQELFMASVFACQGRKGSFFGMAPAEKKALFIDMLGLDHLQALSEQAKARRDDLATESAALQRQAADLRERCVRMASLQTELQAATAALATAQAAGAAAAVAHAEATAELETAREGLAAARATAASAGSQLLDEQKRRWKINAAIQDTKSRLEAAERAAAGADEAIAAAADLETYRAAREALDTDRSAALLREAERKAAAAESKLNAARERYRELRGEIERLTKIESDLAADGADVDVDAAAKEIDRIQAAIDDLKLPDLEARATAERARDAELQRLSSRRDALESVSRGLFNVDLDNPMCATCALTEAGRSALAEREELAEKMAGLQTQNTGAAEALQRARAIADGLIETMQHARAIQADARARAQAARQRAAEIADLPAKREFLKRFVVEEAEPLKRAYAAAGDEAIRAKEAHDAVVARAQEIHNQIAAVRDAAGRRDAAVAAKAEIGALRDALRRLSDDVTECDVSIASRAGAAEAAGAALEAAELEESAAKAKLAELTGELERCRERTATAAATEASCTGAIRALGSPAEELERIESDLAAVHADAEAFALLQRSLGRDGVQALEIAEAAPGVTDIANELLESCFGPRFSLDIQTVVPKADGKGTKEVFDVRVLDAEFQREAKKGSGGESTIWDEALRLALAIYNQQRAGYDLRTLWRDETSGQLDPENADRYVRMLQKARAIGGFERIIFIAHQEQVWRQADKVVMLAA